MSMRLPCAAIAAALMALAAGCGEGRSTGGADGNTTVAGSDPLAAGRAVFTGISGCSGCHALADAGATATVASNLDEKRPTAATVRAAVTTGTGAMPAFAKTLAPREIDDVARYVSTVAGR
jgi:mono/diheme cytochrome c family protein